MIIKNELNTRDQKKHQAITYARRKFWFVVIGGLERDRNFSRFQFLDCSFLVENESTGVRSYNNVAPMSFLLELDIGLAIIFRRF